MCEVHSLDFGPSTGPEKEVESEMSISRWVGDRGLGGLRISVTKMMVIYAINSLWCFEVNSKKLEDCFKASHVDQLWF